MKYFIKVTLMTVLGLLFILGSGGGGGGSTKEPDQSKTYSVTLESVELVDPSGNAITVNGLPLAGESIEVK